MLLSYVPDRPKDIISVHTSQASNTKYNVFFSRAVFNKFAWNLFFAQEINLNMLN